MVVYHPLGYPDLKTSIELMIIAGQCGADIIEIGLPFSDPLADGPTIQRASQIALESGVTISQIWEAVKQIQSKVSSQIFVMTYYNVLLQYGLENFVRDFHNHSLAGVIIPDLPPQEWPETLDNIPRVYLITPNCSLTRAKQLAKQSEFIYVVSNLSITGSEFSIDSRVSGLISHLRSEIPDIPKFLGFGISNKNSIEIALNNEFDGIIIGSALLVTPIDPNSYRDKIICFRSILDTSLT